MKRVMILFLIAMLVHVSGAALASALIVETDGTSRWVESYKIEPERVKFKTKDGERGALSADDVYQVIPNVERGQDYSPDEIDQILRKIRKSEAKFPKLGRQLRVLKQEWRQLQSSDDGSSEKGLDEFVQEFEDSAKDPKTFQDIAVKIDMLRFRDVGGKLDARITDALKQMRKKFYSVNISRLRRIVDRGDSDLEQYVECDNLAEGMKLARLPRDQEEEIDGFVRNCRARVIKSELARARAKFTKGKKSIPAYLISSGILDDLRRHVVETDSEKKELRKNIEGLRESAGKAHRDTNFSLGGFPISTADGKLLKDTGSYASKVNSRTFPLVEQCFMYPINKPYDIKLNKHHHIPLQLIFNRDQPEGREYALFGVYQSPGRGPRRLMRLLKKGLDIKAGRAREAMGVMLKPHENPGEPNARWDPGFVIFLAYKDEDPDAEEPPDWTAASLGCWVPVVED